VGIKPNAEEEWKEREKKRRSDGTNPLPGETGNLGEEDRRPKNYGRLGCAGRRMKNGPRRIKKKRVQTACRKTKGGIGSRAWGGPPETVPKEDNGRGGSAHRGKKNCPKLLNSSSHIHRKGHRGEAATNSVGEANRLQGGNAAGDAEQEWETGKSLDKIHNSRTRRDGRQMISNLD